MTLIWPELALEAAHAAAHSGGTTLRQLPRALYRVCKEGRLNLFVVGCGGTGKTSLGQYLITGSPENAPAAHQSTLTRQRRRANRVEPFADLYDYPGQEGPFTAEFDRDYDRFQSARRNIILMCCSYGYHSHFGESTGFDGGPRTRALPAGGPPPGALDACRENEVQFVARFLRERVRRLPRAHMMTVLLKPDLWYNNLEEVRQFYITRYGAAIEEFLRGFGEDRMTHCFNLLCIRRENYSEPIRGTRRRISQNTLGGNFTGSIEFKLREDFHDSLNSLIQRTVR